MKSYGEAKEFFRDYDAVARTFVAETEPRINLIRQIYPQFNPAQRPMIDRIGGGIARLFEEFNGARKEFFYGSDYADNSYDMHAQKPCFSIRLEETMFSRRRGVEPMLVIEGYHFHPATPRLFLMRGQNEGEVFARCVNHMDAPRILTSAAELRGVLDEWFDSFGGVYRPCPGAPAKVPAPAAQDPKAALG